jgi:hypothetical protein
MLNKYVGSTAPMVQVNEVTPEFWPSTYGVTVFAVQAVAKGRTWSIDAYNAELLRRNHADPLVVLPWSTWEALLEKVRR